MAREKRKKTPETGNTKAKIVAEVSKADPGKSILLIATMAALVARPLVPGEDPGFGSSMTDPSGTTLTLCWFLLAAAWSIWAISRKRAPMPLGFFDLGLLGLAGCYFLSSELVASGLYTARLISWEVLSFFACFISIRWAASDESDRQAIYTVLLATGFAVVAYGIYQYSWEMPYLRQKYGENLEQLKRDFISQSGGTIEAEGPFMEQLRQRLMQTHIYSTFSHPNTLASFLCLLIPGALGGVWLAARNPSRKVVIAGVSLIGFGFLTALWMNFSRGAFFATGLVLAILFLHWSWRKFTERRVLALLFTAGAFLMICFGAWLVSTKGLLKKESSGGFSARLEYWKATISMGRSYPWFGVGPGNFGNYYPRFMLPSAEEKIKDPHNLFLEAWSSAGAGALVMVLLITSGIGWRFFRELVQKPEEFDTANLIPTPGWVIYLGGMFGLLLSFVLRVEHRPGEDLVSESIGALIRTAAWFFAMGFLENLKATDNHRKVMLLAGITAMLLNLMVSGSLVFASIISMLVASLGLCITSNRGIRLPAFVVFPPLAGIALYFLVGVFVPLSSAYSYSQMAIRNGSNLLAIPSGRGMPSKLERVQKGVLEPLQQAATMEPNNPRWQLQLANWYSVAFLEASLKGEPMAMQFGNACLASLNNAAKMDRESPEPLLARAQIRGLFAQRNKTEAFAQWMDAAFSMEQAVIRDPHEARHKATLAMALWQANKADSVKGSREKCQIKSTEQAREALRLDKIFQSSSRHLTDRQRSQMDAIIQGKEPSVP